MSTDQPETHKKLESVEPLESLDVLESSDALKTNPATGNAFIRVLKSDSFIEKAFLLIITAVLTGFVIPLVIKSVDTASEVRAEVARAQTKLFDDVSETILTSEALALDVTWFGTAKAKNAEMQDKAFDRYQERTVDLIARWRTETARAQGLASPKIAKKLALFQFRFFNEQDTPMNELWIRCHNECDWETQHQKNEAMLVDANGLILDLAHDLGLIHDLGPAPVSRP